MPKEKAIIVLEALFAGNEIELFNRNCVMTEQFDLAFWCDEFSTKTQETKKVLLGLFMEGTTLSDFIKECNKKTDEEIFLISANTALKELNAKRG